MTPDERKQQFAQNKKSLDRRDNLDRAFPTEYAAVKQEVRTARHQIKDYNRQIRELRAGAIPPNAPQLNMQNAGNVSRQTEDRIRSLKYHRDKIRTDTFDKVSAQTQHASPEKQTRMQGAARKELQKGMSQQARDKQNSTRLELGTTGLDRAQDRFFSSYQTIQPRAQGRGSSRETSRPQTPTQNATSAPQAGNRGSLASMHFSATLNYNKSAEPSKTETTKTEAKKEMPDNKPSNLSAADHFSNSSSLNKAKKSTSTQEPNKDSADKSSPNPTKGKGQDDI